MAEKFLILLTLTWQARRDLWWNHIGAYFYLHFPLYIWTCYFNLYLAPLDNVALKHEVNTSGYLNVNNPNSRQYITRQSAMNELMGIWRERNTETRAFMFDKKQTTNRTKARLDYLLIWRNNERYVSTTHIGWVNALSDHRPIYITITPAIR